MLNFQIQSRRRFFSTVASASAFAALPLSQTFAQDEDVGEVVIVYPAPGKSGGGSGTSIYDRDKLLELKKLAGWMSNTSHFLHEYYKSATGVSAGILKAYPATFEIMVPLTGTLAAGAGLAKIAELMWGKIAVDPPRENYKVDICASTILPNFPAAPDELAATSRVISLLNDHADAARRLWDSLELYQGAELAEDKGWMAKHVNNIQQSLLDAYVSWSQLPVLLVASQREVDLAIGSKKEHRLHIAKLNSLIASGDISTLVQDTEKFMQYQLNTGCTPCFAIELRASMKPFEISEYRPKDYDRRVKDVEASAMSLKALL